ncbi:hypothetical protein OXA12_06685 [Acinetobacter baumannii]|uniref:hypothetical protein n=1 Tax=Acinetobacter baumannii TaxID=470 RepID=UPI0018674FA6|nr:hypothetical protein [Acinetobacter baumannii]MCY2772703.1 hypothetical protein [Acinetobacter baumannii]MCY2775623.1 hypothetical protein [Acinetobacter baumannii]MCY2798791.1 hypothetical protein [Acinetobacter baumannii]MCY2805957.1 hypothetical protein [Acinetobacter baumannii]MCY2886138.1 hypothetical protein [Acinetobacter baumannii]
MLEKLFYTLGLSISLVVLVSCTKQAESKALPPSVEAQFMSADKEIGKMIDDLENRDIPLKRKREILCNTYPEVYKKQYMPTLLKLSPKVYTEETLLRDYEAVISFYKKIFVIHCG